MPPITNLKLNPYTKLKITKDGMCQNIGVRVKL